MQDAMTKLTASKDLIEAVKKGDYATVKDILVKDVSNYCFKLQPNSIDSKDTDCVNANSMHFAAENGDIEMMKLLKAHGGDYEVEDKELATPIFYACRMNKLDTIKWLDS